MVLKVFNLFVYRLILYYFKVVYNTELDKPKG